MLNRRQGRRVRRTSTPRSDKLLCLRESNEVLLVYQTQCKSSCSFGSVPKMPINLWILVSEDGLTMSSPGADLTSVFRASVSEALQWLQGVGFSLHQCLILTWLPGFRIFASHFLLSFGFCLPVSRLSVHCVPIIWFHFISQFIFCHNPPSPGFIILHFTACCCSSFNVTKEGLWDIRRDCPVFYKRGVEV